MSIILAPDGKPVSSNCPECQRFHAKIVEQAALLELHEEAAKTLKVAVSMQKLMQKLVASGRLQHHIDRLLKKAGK